MSNIVRMDFIKTLFQCTCINFILFYFILFLFIQFNVPFKIISAHMRRAKSRWGENGRNPRKTT